MPVVRTSVRVDAGSGPSAAVLPALVSSARLRGASSRARARAGRIRRRDRASRARATRRPRLRASVRDRRRRARSGVAGRARRRSRTSERRRLAARRGSSTLGVPPRMIVMSSWAESGQRWSGEVRERERSFAPLAHRAATPPMHDLGRAAVALDARRAGGEHDRDPGLAAGRAMLLRKGTFRRHVVAGRQRSRPVEGSPHPRAPTGRVGAAVEPTRESPSQEGAEGATSPESLRLKDREGEATLESRSPRLAGWPHRRGKPVLRRISQVPRQRGKVTPTRPRPERGSHASRRRQS